MAAIFANQYGRRQTRGLRPWLLVPKVIGVCFYIGALAALAVLWFTGGFTRSANDDPRRLWLVNTASTVAVRLIVPSFLAAISFGAALFLQHPRQFIRMRWLLVKLATLAVLAPLAHWFLSSRLAILRSASEQHTSAGSASAQFGWGIVIVLVVSLWIVFLGRVKPRLHQNWAKAYAASISDIAAAPDPSHKTILPP